MANVSQILYGDISAASLTLSGSDGSSVSLSTESGSLLSPSSTKFGDSTSDSHTFTG